MIGSLLFPPPSLLPWFDAAAAADDALAAADVARDELELAEDDAELLVDVAKVDELLEREDDAPVAVASVVDRVRVLVIPSTTELICGYKAELTWV
jgi:hypothetical protein